MKARTVSAILACAVIAMATRGLRADTLEQVKKKIHDKVSSYKTLSYKAKTTTDSEVMKSDLDMTCEYMRKGDKVLARIEQKGKMIQNMGGSQQKMDTSSLTIFDGSFNYTYSEMMGQKSAFKQKLNPEINPSPFNANAAFAQSEKIYNMKLLPDETVNGKPAFAIEMTMKDETMRQHVGRTVTYYDKGTGICLKSVTIDPKGGKPSSTMIVTDIKIDPSISPDRFVFKAPPGVEVMDMTKMSTPGG